MTTETSKNRGLHPDHASFPFTAGPYVLIELIGRGANSRVFRGRGQGGEQVAVKLLSGGMSRRVRREWEAYARLNHPNLLSLIDAGVDPSQGAYLVTPLLDGSTLREFAAGKRLCPDSVLSLLTPVLSGLAVMHRNGFMHRDMKPENIMITREGRPVILDLGLAHHASHSRLTREGTVAGSVPYLSPEQIEGGGVTPGCDVWAVGVMTYELICGRRPFQRQLEGEEVAAILGASYLPLYQADRRSSKAFSDLTGECLSRKPENRPADAGALLKRWTKLAKQERASVKPAELRSLVANPQAHMKAVAARRCNELKKLARKGIEAKDSFDALTQIDRALAYCPDDEDIRSLVDAAARLDESGPRKKRNPVRTRVGWLRPILSMLTSAVVTLAIILLLWPYTSVPDPKQPGRIPAVKRITKPIAPGRQILEPVQTDRIPAGKQVPSNQNAEAEFYQGAGRLARLMMTGIEKQASKSGRKLSNADEAAIDVVGGFADLFIDLASDKPRAEGVEVSPDGQEASARLLGSLVKLFEAGLKAEIEN